MTFYFILKKIHIVQIVAPPMRHIVAGSIIFLTGFFRIILK